MVKITYKDLVRNIEQWTIEFYGINYFTGLINCSKNYDLSEVEILDERYFTYIMNIFEFGYIKDILNTEDAHYLHYILSYFSFTSTVIENLVFQSQLSLSDQKIKSEEDRIRFTYCNIVEHKLNENIIIDLFNYREEEGEEKESIHNYELVDLSFCKLTRPSINVSDFEKGIKNMSYNTLKLLPLNEPEFAKHLFIAGGFVLGCLMDGNFQYDENNNKKKMSSFDDFDIDIFIYGLKTEEEANIFLKKLFHKIVERKNMYTEIYRNDLYFSRNNHTITLYIFNSFRYNGHFERSNFQIQFILRLYESPEQILCGFDVDSCCVGFTNNSLIALPRFVRAYKKGYNLIDPNRESPSYTYRLIKYSLRGFNIAVLPHIYKNYKANLNNHLFAQGIGKLIYCQTKLDKFNASQKYKNLRKYRYRRRIYTMKKSIPTIKLYYTKNITEQELYDFIDFIKNIDIPNNLNSPEDIIEYIQTTYPETKIIFSNKNYNFIKIIKNEIIENKKNILNEVTNLFDNIIENEERISKSTYDTFYKVNKNVRHNSFHFIVNFCNSNKSKKNVYFSQSVDDIFLLPEDFNIPRRPTWINSLRACLQDSTNEFFKGVF